MILHHQRDPGIVPYMQNDAETVGASKVESGISGDGK